MAKEPGNARNRARRINFSDRPKTFRNSIGDGDRLDFFRFNLSNRSSFNLTLRGLRQNANVSLLDSRGQVLQRSRRPGRRNEAIQSTLDAGVYFVRVEGKRSGTRYRLRLAASDIILPPVSPPVVPPVVPGGSTPDPTNPGGGVTPTNPTNPGGGVTPTNPTNPTNPGGGSPPPIPSNTAPSITVNTRLTTAFQGSGLINQTILQTTDPEQTAAQLTYTLTRLPSWGDVLLNGAPLTLNGTFTQADVDNNRVTYQNRPIAQVGDGKTLVSAPKISGANLVWAASDGQDAEIFFYNGATGAVSQLTNNTVDDRNPQISGTNLAWQRGTGNNLDIFFYEGSSGTTKQLTNDSAFERKNLRIDGSVVAWEQSIGNDSDVVMYNHSTNTTITTSGFNDTNPHVSGSQVIFERRNASNPFEGGIYVYNFATQMIAPVIANTQTKLGGVSGSTVVWERLFVSPDERNIEYGQIGNSSQSIDMDIALDDFSPLVSGSYIAFVRNQIGADTTDGLYLFNRDTSALTRLSNSATDLPFALSGSNVVWQAGSGDTEILFYNGTTGQTTSLTNNIFNDSDPAISGENIVWQSGTGTNRNQVFFYNALLTEDSFNFQVSDGSATVTQTLNITISG